MDFSPEQQRQDLGKLITAGITLLVFTCGIAVVPIVGWYLAVPAALGCLVIAGVVIAKGRVWSGVAMLMALFILLPLAVLFPISILPAVAVAREKALEAYHLSTNQSSMNAAGNSIGNEASLSTPSDAFGMEHEEDPDWERSVSGTPGNRTWTAILSAVEHNAVSPPALSVHYTEGGKSQIVFHWGERMGARSTDPIEAEIQWGTQSPRRVYLAISESGQSGFVPEWFSDALLARLTAGTQIRVASESRKGMVIVATWRPPPSQLPGAGPK